MCASLTGQAEALHRVLGNLIRGYQLRDRDEICCHGISVAQCYALQVVGEAGSPKMSELADRLQLKVSTLTRTVDQLVAQDLVSRCDDPRDRRICCVTLTPEGRRILDTINREIIEIEKDVLRRIPAEDREPLIRGLTEIADALAERRARSASGCNCGKES